MFMNNQNMVTGILSHTNNHTCGDQDQVDEHWMRIALSLAKRGEFTTSPNPCVGCVIVKDGRILGQGFHVKAGQAHAEVNALRNADENGADVTGSTVYVTLEPCSHYGRTPPCALSLVKRGVARVVAAMADPNPKVSGKGFKILLDAGIEVKCGVLSGEAEELNWEYLFRMRQGRPWVQLKLACSLDGRIALANGESKWITSPEARHDVQIFRARSSAILTTSKTVLADDPFLNVRKGDLPSEVADHYPLPNLRQPDVILLDSRQAVTSDRNLFKEDRRIIWIIGSGDPSGDGGIVNSYEGSRSVSSAGLTGFAHVSSTATDIPHSADSTDLSAKSDLNKPDLKVFSGCSHDKILICQMIGDNPVIRDFTSVSLNREHSADTLNELCSITGKTPQQIHTPENENSGKHSSVNQHLLFPDSDHLATLEKRLECSMLNKENTQSDKDLVNYKEKDKDLSQADKVSSPGNFYLKPLLEKMATLEINSIFVEAGSLLAGSLIRQNLVDELIIYMAPKFLGCDGKSIVDLCGYQSLTEVPEFQIVSCQQIGTDLRIILRRKDQEK